MLSRGSHRSHSPQMSSVGAAIRARSIASSNAKSPSSVLGVAVAALVQGVGVVAWRQQGQNSAVGEPRVGVGGQKEDRLPARVALLRIVNSRVAGKPHGGKP
jgi:hypothetical protein